MSQEVDLSQVSIDEFAQLLAIKLEQEAADYNELADAYESLNDQFINKALENELLKEQLAEKARSLSRTEGQGTQLNVELLKLKGQLKATRNQLKELQSAGDPIRLKKKNRELKDLSDERRDTIKEQQKRITELKSQINKSKQLLQGQGDSPIYSNDNNEVVFLHNQKLLTQFEGGSRVVVMLKYWHPFGVGLLVSWDGTKICVSDGSIPNLTKHIQMSPDVVDFCTGWFTEHVIVKGDVQQYRETKKLA